MIPTTQLLASLSPASGSGGHSSPDQPGVLTLYSRLTVGPRGGQPTDGLEQPVEDGTGMRIVERFRYPRGGVGSIWGTRVGLEPVHGGGLGDVTELRDDHGAVPATIYASRS